MTIKTFEVGGCVRDSILGVSSKDIDIAVEAESYDAFKQFVTESTKKIFLEKPEFFTIRALDFDNQAKDFVLCRKDGAYSDSRHPDEVSVGTILDDLARRDFTMNAIAKIVNPVGNDHGSFLDPFGGIVDLKDKVIRAVGSAEKRFDEDPLRIIRAMRFSITKQMQLSDEIAEVFADSSWAERLSSVSKDRIREELNKCFEFSTLDTLRFFEKISKSYSEFIFGERLSLQVRQINK